MADLLVLGAGLTLVGLALLDAGWTIWWVDGDAGPLTRLLLRGLRRLSRARRGRGRSRSLLGPASMAGTLLLWLSLLGAGWTLVFASDAASLAPTGSLPPPDLVAKAYFVAYTLLTMGNGDYVPVGAPWQAATGVAVLSGLVLLTLAITYTLSVLGGVVEKRATAGRILGLGSTPADLVAAGWDGTTMGGFDRLLPELAAGIGRSTEQHLAYPVLHFYDADDARVSLPVAVAVLDEAVSILRAVEPGARPSPLVLADARSAAERYAATLVRTFVDAPGEAPASPDVSSLAARGIIVDAHALAEEISAGGTRRARLRGAIEAEGRSWRDVSGRGA